MRAAGVKNMQIMAKIAPDGSVSFQSMPNVQQLNELKIALGTIARAETDAITGKISGPGLRAQKLAGDLRDAITDAVPAYRTAVRLGGDKIAEDGALDMGRKLLLPGTTKETVAATMSGASREAKDAARRGMREYIDNSLGNIQRTIGGTETEVREAMALIKQLSSRNNMDKVKSVLGTAQSERLFKALDEAAAQFETRAAVATGSQTFGRQEGQRMLNEITAPRLRNAATEALNFQPGTAFKQLSKMFTAPGSDLQRASNQTLLAEVTRALTTKRGAQAQAALKAVQDAMAGQPMKAADAARLARQVTSALALGGYQTGTRLQSQP